MEFVVEVVRIDASSETTGWEDLRSELEDFVEDMVLVLVLKREVS